MNKKARRSLLLQNFWGRIAVVILAPLYFLTARILCYRVRNLKEIRRRCYAEMAAHPGGWIICSNHLTMIDSFLLSYAIFSLRQHITHYEKLPWNLPEWNNYRSNIFLRFLCYLSKCIPVQRGGSREMMKEVMEKCVYLLEHGATIMIFPEGRRSRTGCVDRECLTYGAGRLIKHVPNTKVMCLYLRGDKQKTYSIIPAWGDQFYVQMEVFTPEVLTGSDLRVQREYSTQIVEKIIKMEEEYFAVRGKRCGGFEGTTQHRKKHGFTFPKKSPHRC